MKKGLWSALCASLLIGAAAQAEMKGSETQPYVEGQEALVAPNKSDALKSDPRWSCVWNNTDTWFLYVSYRFDGGGVRDLTLWPRSAHQLFVGNSNGWVCWQFGSPMGGACPNATRLRPTFAGNCP